MKVAVLGASNKEDRYAYRATVRLKSHGHEVFPIGLRKGNIEGEEILATDKLPDDVHTVTLYLNAKNQEKWYDELLRVKPQRVIFNPGTENEKLENMLEEEGIKVVENCTLVMLSLQNF